VKKIALVALLLLSLASYGAATCFVDFLTESLPQFTIGTATNFQIQVCCGTAPYTFTLVSGTMPAGLSLSSSGVISGTPTGPASDTTICIRLDDSAGCHLTMCFAIRVE
jgi:hypothetical protein